MATFGLGEISRSFLFCWQPIKIPVCLLSSSLDFSLMFLLNVFLILISEDTNRTYGQKRLDLKKSVRISVSTSGDNGAEIRCIAGWDTFLNSCSYLIRKMSANKFFPFNTTIKKYSNYFFQ
jgi:hypothetical protein